jgi:hypothetical protein
MMAAASKSSACSKSGREVATWLSAEWNFADDVLMGRVFERIEKACGRAGRFELKLRLLAERRPVLSTYQFAEQLNDLPRQKRTRS